MTVGRPIRAVHSLGALLLASCGQWVSPQDGALDAEAADARDDERAVLDVASLPDADATVLDVPSPIDVADIARPDAVGPEAGACETPATPRPARSLRSCSGANAAPAEHCREVWNCGGLTPVGSTDAWSYNLRDGVVPQSVGCEIGRVDVHPGYVDAYEVSVARFRAWVRAGFPQPRNGTRYWTGRNDVLWSRIAFREPLSSCRPGEAGCDAPAPPDPINCTYRSTPGENDNLPVNCIGQATAYAFCWWEGKHPITDAAWAQLATNRGTTRRPFVAGARGTFDPCVFADVAGCPRTAGLPLPIDSRPLGQTIETPGIFSLWGGLREITLEHPLTPLGCLLGDALGEFASEYSIYSLRGLSYRDTGVVAERLDHAATRQDPARGYDTPLAAQGIRCARWDPEPTDLTE